MNAADWPVVGHEWAARLLQEHLARNETRHAYLFTGPSGVGRRTLAVRFAQALNCLQPPVPGGYCGQCRVCRQTEQMQHVDLALVQPDTEGGMLKIEHIRDLLRSLSLMPYEAHYRVALLLNFNQANLNAQNALLKTLEEAPPRVILLLTADSGESLLPTILSRCEVLRLRPMSVARLEGELLQRGLSPEDARLLAHLAGGRLGYALHLQEEPKMLELRRSYLDDLNTLLGASRRERFSYAETIISDRDSLRLGYQIWLSFWRDVLLRTAALSLPVVNLDFEAEINHLAARVGLSEARKQVSALEGGLTRLDGNLNARLLTEVLLLDWPFLSA